MNHLYILTFCYSALTDVDARVDVWALGCTMYCLAFGRSPFESAKTGVVEKLGILNGRYTVPAGGRMRNSVFGEGYLDLVKVSE